MSCRYKVECLVSDNLQIGDFLSFSVEESFIVREASFFRLSVLGL